MKTQYTINQRRAIEALEALFPQPYASDDEHIHAPAWRGAENSNSISYQDVYGIGEHGDEETSRFESSRGMEVIVVDNYFYEQSNDEFGTWRIAYKWDWDWEDSLGLSKFYQFDKFDRTVKEWPTEVYGVPGKDWPAGIEVSPAPDGVPIELYEFKVEDADGEWISTNCFTTKLEAAIVSFETE